MSSTFFISLAISSSKESIASATIWNFSSVVLGAKGINSGLSSMDGMASGLLSFSDWELAPYYYVNLSRQDEVNAKIPKSISLEGTNISEKPCDHLVFVCYSREMSLDCLTGQVMV